MKNGRARYSQWMPMERIIDDHSQDASRFADCFGISKGLRTKCDICHSFEVCRELRQTLSKGAKETERMSERKASLIVEQHTGEVARSPEHFAISAEYARLVVVYEDGQKQELFRGREFDISLFKARMKCFNNISILDRIKKTKDGYIVTSGPLRTD